MLNPVFVVVTSLSRGRGRGRNKSRGRGRNSSRGGRSSSPADVAGRGQNQNTSQPSGHRFDKSKIQCHYCKKIGHYAYECRKNQYDQGKQNQNQLTNTNTSSSTMLMACTSPIECNTIQEIPCDTWYLDSGCSNNMYGNLNLFSSLDNSVQTDVTLGNNVQSLFWEKILLVF